MGIHAFNADFSYDELIAGADPDEDRKPLDVTEAGVTLIAPAMLGQPLQHLR